MEAVGDAFQPRTTSVFPAAPAAHELPYGLIAPLGGEDFFAGFSLSDVNLPFYQRL